MRILLTASLFVVLLLGCSGNQEQPARFETEVIDYGTHRTVYLCPKRPGEIAVVAIDVGKDGWDSLYWCQWEGLPSRNQDPFYYNLAIWEEGRGWKFSNPHPGVEKEVYELIYLLNQAVP